MKSQPWLQIWTALCAIALITSTWKLWFSIPQPDSFPRIPLFKLPWEIPSQVDWGLAAGLLVGWGWLALSSYLKRNILLAGVLTLACGLSLVVLNQHRFQPWHYQMLVFVILFLFAPATQVQMLRVFVVSIYAYSAVSKLDFEFLHTVGIQFSEQAIKFLGLADRFTASPLIASLLPLAELLVAVGLINKVTRRWAGWCACVMHLGIFMLLSPWGLDHSWGVLIWNVYFAGVALLLFSVGDPETEPSLPPVPTSEREVASKHSDAPSGQLVDKRHGWLSRRLATCLLIPILVLPLGERWSLWDHWPSWALYAPHSSRVEVQVAVSAVDRLPASLRALMPDTEPTDLWVRVPIGRWSLAEVGAPIYPQARFQAGVASYLSGVIDSPFEIRAIWKGTASRWSGARVTREYMGSDIEKLSERFLLNASPRNAKQSARS